MNSSINHDCSLAMSSQDYYERGSAPRAWQLLVHGLSNWGIVAGCAKIDYAIVGVYRAFIGGADELNLA